ncbi:MAG: hypothetical protein E7167_01140 [Firmicutes bacterium]|nr:hypothetical protein [Bacillota bacterium]
MYLPNISVHFCVSSTGTQKNFLKHFSNLDNIKKHINFWDKEIRQLIETTKNAKNPSIFVNSMINFPTIATPQETSSTEGMEIVKLIKVIEQTLYTENAFRRTND